MAFLKTTRFLPLAAAMVSGGCAAPYLHKDARLGLSTAEMSDSRIEQEAMLLTVTLPLWSRKAPASVKNEELPGKLDQLDKE